MENITIPRAAYNLLHRAANDNDITEIKTILEEIERAQWIKSMRKILYTRIKQYNDKDAFTLYTELTKDKEQLIQNFYKKLNVDE